jgi:uncharacterized protein (TIGR02996 family)
MDDRDLLIETICAEPAADGPILALADWFEEYGPEESAETCRWWVALRRRVRELLPPGEWPGWPEEWPSCPRPPAEGSSFTHPYELRARDDADFVHFHRGVAASWLCASEYARAVKALRPDIFIAPRSCHVTGWSATLVNEAVVEWVKDALQLLCGGPPALRLRHESDYLSGRRTPGRHAIWLMHLAADSATYHPDDPDADDEARRTARGGCLSMAVAYFGVAFDLTPPETPPACIDGFIRDDEYSYAPSGFDFLLVDGLAIDDDYPSD